MEFTEAIGIFSNLAVVSREISQHIRQDTPQELTALPR